MIRKRLPSDISFLPHCGIDDVINRGSFPFRSRRRNGNRSPGKGTAGKGERKTCDERCRSVGASALRRPRGGRRIGARPKKPAPEPPKPLRRGNSPPSQIPLLPFLPPYLFL
ncbi:hypothetical protein B296_00037576 [Ensete ventricosum]|uniref:Uncharacterized protein n=1 Tax=Ensete ventricosum TaxID=4639 RepID=A0A426ZS19_ENSVE|nr:hypothetical protein B296_00037576 [Ensete ventricosum]